MSTTRLVRRLAASALAVCALLLVARTATGGDIPGYPQLVTGYDPREVAMLPKYCIYTQLFRDNVPGGNNPAEIQRWHAIMGDIFIHMHHYCYGLMYLNRATLLARSAEIRGYNFNNAIMEFDYVLARAPKDFVLLPEILTKKGEVMLRQGRAPLAMTEFERAIEIKPDYWPPYAQMSDHYASIGDKEKAREILQRGLAQVPGATALQRRLRELDDASRSKVKPR
jgi:tetratricopeptide (TPR) repeat protein